MVQGDGGIVRIHALGTYLTTNWERLHANSFEEQRLHFASVRAEAQVRERTKPRFRQAVSEGRIRPLEAASGLPHEALRQAA